MRAVLLGYSGLVGSFVLQELVQESSFETIHCIGRKRAPALPKVNYVFSDFSNLEEIQKEFQVNVVFCCLGTTIAKAKTKEKFYEVDYEFVLRSGRIAKNQGVEKFLLVTALGANPNSLFYYNQVKGEIEKAMEKLDFPFLGIFRPSLLLGPREELRLGEKIGEGFGKFIAPFLFGSLAKYRPIEAKDVAKGMVKVSKLKKIGTEIYESDTIYKLSQGEI
ncbi:MAG: NAD-dependent epimerase/dehydratase family protein [Leptospiraceae bacterium]|nr:NAD-dependent epimerase/dehydratase family protein [Leptospiraceae bacterium]